MGKRYQIELSDGATRTVWNNGYTSLEVAQRDAAYAALNHNATAFVLVQSSGRVVDEIRPEYRPAA